MKGHGPMKTFAAVLALLAATPASAQQSPAAVEVPAFPLPPSDQLSEDATAVLLRMRAARSPNFCGDPADQPPFYQPYIDERLSQRSRHFQTARKLVVWGQSVTAR